MLAIPLKAPTADFSLASWRAQHCRFTLRRRVKTTSEARYSYTSSACAGAFWERDTGETKKASKGKKERGKIPGMEGWRKKEVELEKWRKKLRKKAVNTSQKMCYSQHGLSFLAVWQLKKPDTTQMRSFKYLTLCLQTNRQHDVSEHASFLPFCP